MEKGSYGENDMYERQLNCRKVFSAIILMNMEPKEHTQPLWTMVVGVVVNKWNVRTTII